MFTLYSLRTNKTANKNESNLDIFLPLYKEKDYWLHKNKSKDI